MVRKRTRTSRKYYESDDNDSDSDYSLDDIVEPTQKKYSLRQRKRPVVTQDFAFDDEEEVEPHKHTSEDEDFQLEDELSEENKDFNHINNITCHNPPECEDLPEDDSGLIDFEDIIRADIVVNRNKIDYDNIIEKSEIKILPLSEEPVRPKRGRKPKKKEKATVENVLEPETEVTVLDQKCEFQNETSYNVEQVNPEVVEPATALQDVKHDSLPISNSVHSNGQTLKDINDSFENCDKDSITEKINIDSRQENDNSKDTREPGAIIKNLKEECQESDDDVILIENDKCEIIVLDD